MGSAKIDTSYIYVMGLETGDGPCKVGRSMDTAKRVKMLSAQYGKNLIVMGKWPVGAYLALQVERYTHWLLRDRHYSGEWFSVTASEAAAAIEQAVNAPITDKLLLPPIDVPGRKILNGEHIAVKFPSGTRAAISNIMGGADGRADFIREAVEREIARRSHVKSSHPALPSQVAR
jgi:hypothetical protein